MDYKNAKIYKLVNDELNLTYYGSTCTALHKRLYQHKSKSNTSSSKIMFESGEVKIFLVELFPTENKILLTQRERYFIENNECINKTIPNRTKKEYYIDNKDKIKEYYLLNKEKIKQKNKGKIKEYYLLNKDKIKQKNKEYGKEYNVKNKEKIKERMKEYYLLNKEKYKQKKIQENNKRFLEEI